MKRQDFFFACLVLAGLIPAGYFSILAASSIADYCSRSESAEARILRWEINEMKGKYPIKGYYSFEVKGAAWSGSTRLGEPWHLNEPAAIASLQEMAKRKWAVWYDPANPSLSSLEKNFPYGLAARALTCYGVLAYFALFARKFIRNI